MAQKTTLIAIAALLMAAVTVGFASAERARPDRPPGVTSEQWYPISDRLGLVLADYQPGSDALVDDGMRPPPAGTVLSPEGELKPERNPSTLSGYLMVKQRGHWTRLSVRTPPACPPGIAEQFCAKAAPIESSAP